MSKGCLEFIWRVFGRCLDVFSGNIKGVLRLHGGYLEVVWKVSGSIHEKRCICTDTVWGNLLGLGTFFVNITVFFAHYRVWKYQCGIIFNHKTAHPPTNLQSIWQVPAYNLEFSCQSGSTSNLYIRVWHSL